MCRNRSYDCQWLAERASNPRVRDILLDMARTWTRLALEAEEWRRDNSPKSRLAKKDATKDRFRSLVRNHPDRLTSNRMEAQSQLNRIEWGNHEKGKEARQIQEFIETTSKVEEEFKACRRQVEDSQTDKDQAADEIEKIQPS